MTVLHLPIHRTRAPAAHCRLFRLRDFEGGRERVRWALILLDTGDEAFADIVASRDVLPDILADAESMRAQGLRVDLGGFAEAKGAAK